MNSKTVEKAANRAAAAARGQAALAFVAIVAVEVLIGTAVLHLTGRSPLVVAVEAAAPPDLPDAQKLAQWAASTGDAGQRPFVIVDKVNARVMAFDASGRLNGSTPALLGLARGDDSVPGIGLRKIADIKPEERVTPAGRFVAQRGTNLSGEDIVWVDYDAAVSMHRVRAHVASERRLERLASETVDDNRISYGCINLPAAFYDRVIHPLVSAGPVVIYVMPETRPLGEVFALGHSSRAARRAS